MEDNKLIVKSNDLVEASYRLTISEQRIILKLVSEIKINDIEFKPYRFKVSEFINMLGIKDQSKYTELPKITEGLMKKILKIREGNSILQIAWLSSCQYFEGQGVVELEFSPKLKPYLLQLKSRFTRYNLQEIIQLKSFYSLRIYEILKQYEKIGSRILEIEEMRHLFQIEKGEYERYNDFKRFVILQAQKEINSKTDLYFDFEEIKTSRKVTSIKFIIKSSGIPAATSEVNALEKLDDIDDILGIMDKHNISKADAKKIHKAASGDMKKIMKCYAYTLTQNVDNVVAYMIRLCKEFSEPITNKSNAGSKPKNKFMNFEQTPYDFEKIEKMELERTLKNIGKLK